MSMPPGETTVQKNQQDKNEKEQWHCGCVQTEGDNPETSRVDCSITVEGGPTVEGENFDIESCIRLVVEEKEHETDTLEQEKANDGSNNSDVPVKAYCRKKMVSSQLDSASLMPRNQTTTEQHEVIRNLESGDAAEGTSRCDDDCVVPPQNHALHQEEGMKTDLSNTMKTDLSESDSISGLAPPTLARKGTFRRSAILNDNGEMCSSVGFKRIEAQPDGRTRTSVCLTDGTDKRKMSSVLFGSHEADFECNDISRTELENIFLSKAGVLVSEGILDEIFQEADTDRKGCLCPAKITAYINGIDRKSQSQRRFSVTKKVLFSFSTICSLSFIIGAMSSVSTNLRSRSFGDLFDAESHYYNQIAGWLFQFGALGFISMVYEQEKLQFHRYRNTYRKLVRWIRWDLPHLVEKKMSEQGLNLSTRACNPNNTRVSFTTFVRENSAGLGSVFSDHITDEQLCPMQLRVLLEDMGTFMFHDELKQVFTEINKGGGDASKKASLKDLMDFAKEKEKVLHEDHGRPMSILLRSARCLSFWTSLAYVIGTVPVWLLDFIGGSPALRLHLNGFSCICYSLGAIGGVPIVWHSSASSLSDRHQLDEKLRSVAIKLGMLTKFFDRSLVRMSSVRHLSNNHLSGLQRRKIAGFHHKGAAQLFELAFVQEDDYLESAQFYRIMSDLGVSMAVIECDALWKRIGPNEENKIQTAKLIKYIQDIDPDRAINFSSVCRNMISGLSFFLAMLGVVASTLHTIAAYLPYHSTATPNLYLAGSFGYMFSTFIVLNETAKSAGRQYDMLQANRFSLKEAIVAASDGPREGSGTVSITDVAAEFSSGKVLRDRRAEFMAQTKLSKQSSRILEDLAKALSDTEDLSSSLLSLLQ